MADANGTTPTPPALSPNDWAKMLDDLNSKSGGRWFKPQVGKTRLRLFQPQTGPFYMETTKTYRGKQKNVYMLLAVVLDMAKGYKPEWATQVKPIILPTTAIRSILGLLAEGYDLFHPVNGLGLSIIRTGEGLDTSYTIMASPKAVPLPAGLQLPEKTLAQLAQEYAEDTAARSRRGQSEDSEDEEAGPRGRRPAPDRAQTNDW